MKKQYDIKGLRDSLKDSAFFQPTTNDAKETQLNKPLDETTPPKTPDNLAASKPANQQTSKVVSEIASKLVSNKTSKEENVQTSNSTPQEFTKNKKKYGTYLTEDSILQLQMHAVRTKRKDHEILQTALDEYLKKVE